MNDRAVVLCRTAAGMRGATWLAQRGVAVRVLCVPREVPTEAIALVAGPRPRLEALLGPLDPVDPQLSLWHGGGVQPLPRRKRELASIVRGGRGGALGELLLARLHGGGTAEDWVVRYFGRAAWRDAVQGWLDQRLAGPSARAPAGVARRLLGGSAHGGWWRPRWGGATRAARRVEAILDAGGEVLTEVAVEGLEIDGQVVGVRSDLGFETVEGPLYTDLTPAELADLVDGEPFVPPRPPMGDRIRVEVDGRIPGDATMVLDGVRRVLTLARPHGGEGVVVDAVLAQGDPLHSAPDPLVAEAVRQRLDGLVSGLGAVRSLERQRERVACPRPSQEAPWEELGVRLTSLGIQPLGETGLLLPLSLLDELDVLEQAAEGAVVRTQRERWLAEGPPMEPWSLLVQA